MGRTGGPDHYVVAVHGPTDLSPGDARWRGEEAKKVEQEIRSIGFSSGCRIRTVQKHGITHTLIALCLWEILSGTLFRQKTPALADITAELESSLAHCSPTTQRSAAPHMRALRSETDWTGRAQRAIQSVDILLEECRDSARAAALHAEAAQRQERNNQLLRETEELRRVRDALEAKTVAQKARLARLEAYCDNGDLSFKQ